ncbi:MAG: hypothetical protein QOG81_2187 [Gaiellaceae bacterium]|nr:hypothetical protein [Gaiellaceae bacterium]MDX6519174.1 hypothetical protein [Gaiellaceae bacterium]
MSERLDEAKLATLRLWAEGLARDERDEMRAAARAILLLIDDVESLHMDLWHARGLGATEEDPSVPETLRSALGHRLRTLRGEPAAPAQPSD